METNAEIIKDIYEYNNSITHKLNNLISVVTSVPDILLRKSLENSISRNLLTNLQQASVQMNLLNKNLALSNSRYRMKPVKMDSVELLKMIANSSALPHSVHVRFDLPSNPVWIQADEIQIVNSISLLFTICCFSLDNVHSLQVHNDYTQKISGRTRKPFSEITLTIDSRVIDSQYIHSFTTRYIRNPSPQDMDILELSLSLISRVICDHDGFTEIKNNGTDGTELIVFLPGA